MATELLDVIDTAVKIGLGALISGVAAFSIAHVNHIKEKGREIRAKKTNMLEEISELIDAYFSAFSNSVALIDGAIHSGFTTTLYKTLVNETSPDGKPNIYRNR